MDRDQVMTALRRKFGEATQVRPDVFRVNRALRDRPYAILYFDASGAALREDTDWQRYQEELVADTYFQEGAPGDLRWNHYLYILASREERSNRSLSQRIKLLESDRVYARKRVLSDEEFLSLTALERTGQVAPSQDVVAEWTQLLDQSGLAFVADDAIPATKAAQLASEGRRQSARKGEGPAALSDEGRAAASEMLKRLTVEGFGSHFGRRTFEFGRVNLISGVNGAGKTSLLEAIEFLFSRDNRRERPHRDGAQITGWFGDQEVRLTTAASTSATELRARNFHWYARSDVKKSTLLDGFSKFNFLDTDAAVRLSIDGSSGSDIGRDVSRLVLGAEAERITARVERVSAQVRDRFRQARTELAEIQKKIAETERRLASYRAVPGLSDELFTAFQLALAGCHWLGSYPVHKEECLQLVSPLTTCTAAAGFLLNTSGVDVAELHLLESERDMAYERLQAADSEIARITDLRVAVATAVQKERDLRRRAHSLDELEPYAAGGFHVQLLERARVQSQVSASSRSIPTLEAALAALLMFDSRMPLTRGIDHLETRSAASVERLRDVHRREEQLRSLSERVRSLRQQLFASASGLLPHLEDPDQCPLCLSALPPGELVANVAAAANELGSAALQLAQAERIELERLAESSTEAVTALRLLSEMLSLNGNENVGDVTARIDVLIDEFKAARERMKQLDEWYAREQRSGRSLDTFEELCVASAVDTDISMERLLELRGQLQSKINEVAMSRQSAEESSERAGIRLAELVGQHVTEGLGPEDAMPSLREHVARAERAAGCAGTLAEYCSVRDRRVSELHGSLLAASTALSRLLTAITEETSAASQRGREETSLHELHHRSEAAKATITRLQEAGDVLDPIVAQANQGGYVNKVLGDMTEQIARVFADIHSPAEFSVEQEMPVGLAIRRIRTQERVTTDQMSTGQRSAYALSLFLSMNSTLRTGPRVVLLDDPIAHVDDLNALSFLDHLRTVAINGGRQIFFATADDKIAALFRQKFRFLGATDFQDLALVRPG